MQCTESGLINEHLVDVPGGGSPEKDQREECPECGECAHKVVLSLVARYEGENIVSPNVTGGSYDTAGYKALQKLPEFKGETADDFKQHSSTREFQEIKEARKVRISENKVKRERAAAIKGGQRINMRDTKLPGDPNVMS